MVVDIREVRIARMGEKGTEDVTVSPTKGNPVKTMSWKIRQDLYYERLNSLGK